MVVAVVATGAAGVKDNLFRSGSSSDFRRRGEPPLPDGDVGCDELGETCVGREGIGRRRDGCRDLAFSDEDGVESRDEPALAWLGYWADEEEASPDPGPTAPSTGRDGEPCA